MMMKGSLFAASVVLVQGTSPDFDAYKAKFGKTYASPAAEAKAKACWQENVRDLVQRMARNSDVQFAENDFSDQCWEDFAAARMFEDNNGICVKSPVPKYPNSADESKVIDWRVEGYVNPIKDQKSCGSCWAFSAVGCMEAAHFKATGELVSLSEQELVSCDTSDNGCNGGMPGEAFAWSIQNGMDLESEYPYEGSDSSCKTGQRSVHFSSFSYIDSHKSGRGEPVLLAALQNEGPISITINANRAWHQYSGGIMDVDTCPDTGMISHAVLVVGYGLEGNKAYYVVRNSWGTRWGQDGYIYLAYNKGACSIQSCLSAYITASSVVNETVV
jgi:C1A family cysteine protease